MSTRRQFLKGAGVGVAAILLPWSRPSAPPSTPIKKGAEHPLFEIENVKEYIDWLPHRQCWMYRVTCDIEGPHYRHRGRDCIVMQKYEMCSLIDEGEIDAPTLKQLRDNALMAYRHQGFKTRRIERKLLRARARTQVVLDA